MKTKTATSALSVVALVAASLLPASRAQAWPQCPGRITAMASNIDDSLVVIMNPLRDCGCQSNRYVQPPTYANHKATHVNVLAAFLAGIQVSISQGDQDPCLLQEVSLVP